MKTSVKMKNELPWSSQQMWIRVFVFYASITALLFILQLGIGTIIATTTDDLADYVFNSIIYSITGVVGIGLTYIFLKYDDRPMKQIGFTKPNSSIIMFLVSAIITIPAVAIGFVIENTFEIIDVQQMGQNLIDNITLNPFFWVPLSVFTMLGIGVGEEIIFRGYLFRLLESNLSTFKTVTLTSVLFGALHTFLLVFNKTDTLNHMIAVGISATFFGYMFAYAYLATGRNLLFPIAIHGFWDIYIFLFNTDFVYNNFFKVAMEIGSQILAGSFLLFCIYVYVYFYPPENPIPSWEKVKEESAHK